MRNFDETMHEIRCRSKARIVKRRKQIGSVCTALVLAVAVGSLWVFPGNQTVDLPVSSTTAPQFQQTVGYLYIVDFETGEIFPCAESSQEFLAVVSALEPASDDTLRLTQYNHATATGNFAAAIIANDRYRINAIDANGTVKEFELRGTTLYNLETSEVYCLNSTQYQTLAKILRLEQIKYEE